MKKPSIPRPLAKLTGQTETRRLSEDEALAGRTRTKKSRNAHW